MIKMLFVLTYFCSKRIELEATLAHVLEFLDKKRNKFLCFALDFSYLCSKFQLQSLICSLRSLKYIL